MPYVLNPWLDATHNLTEVRFLAGLGIQQCIDLCGVSESTWHRWRREQPPRWATRLILSQCGHLDHLGWHNWQIPAGRLYFNDLSWRHLWEPQHLVMPLFGVKDVSILAPEQTDNVAGLISLHKPSMAL
ncbi:hypothetical protein [Porticoccus sp.]